MNNPILTHVIEQLKEIHEGKNWIGGSFQSKLKDATETSVFIRPIEGLHSISEIFSHLTLWREEAILKINTGTGSKTDDCEENWLPLEQLKAKGWIQIKSDFDSSLNTLIKLLQTKTDSFLSEQYYDTDFKGNYTYDWLIKGMLHHDLYHLGQLGIILKFLKIRNKK